MGHAAEANMSRLSEMNEPSISEVAQAWIRFEVDRKRYGVEKLEHSPAMRDFWAAELVMDWPYREPDNLWSVIVEIWARIDRNDLDLLGALGAGPVEDLLSNWGERYFPAIQKLCQAEPEFKTVLRMVWQSSMSGDLWQKVQDLRGGANL